METLLDYSKEIKGVKTWFWTPLWGVLKYDDFIVNQDFFKWKNIVTQNDIDELIKVCDEKLVSIKNIKINISSNLTLSEVEKKFLLNSLNTVWLKFVLFKNSSYLEAEKAGFELNEKNKNYYLNRVNKLQNMIYWPEISSMDSEKNSVLLELNNIYVNNNSKLSETEKDEYVNYMNKLWF